MDKRAFERLPVNLQSRLFYGNMVYTGIVTNLSENGMFICTKMSFPVDSVLIAVILDDGNTIKVPVKIVRAVRSNNSFSPESSGLGVGLLSNSNEYMDLLSKCRAAHL